MSKESSYVPNSFQTPNGYVDDIMPFLTGEEYKVLIYATRRILGFQKRQDRISLSQFTDGTKSSKDGRTLDSGTGLARETVKNCLENLVKFGLMVKEADNDPKTNEGTLWSLQWNEADVNWQALQEHLEKRSKVNVQRMAKARSVGQTAVSGTDCTPPSGTDCGGGSGTDTQNPGFETQGNTEEEDSSLETAVSIWDRVKVQLECQVPRALFTTYVEPTVGNRFDGNVLMVGVRNIATRDWLESRLQSTAERLLVGICRQSVNLDFVVADQVHS
jgi:hypothetical protein